MKSSSPAEWAAVRRARLRIAVITGAIITLLVTVVGGVAHTVMVRAQNDQVWREVRYSAEYGDLTSPPVCTWLYAPGVTPLANAPKGFPLRADVDRVRGDHENLDRTVRWDDTVYLVSTRYRTDGRVVQAVFDMRFQLADRDHLWFALGVAELVGLLAAVVTGAVLGRRAVAPLVEALTRQERFVTDASHELRTPITQVYTRAQVLARQAAAQEMPDPHRAGLARLADLGRPARGGARRPAAVRAALGRSRAALGAPPGRPGGAGPVGGRRGGGAGGGPPPHRRRGRSPAPAGRRGSGVRAAACRRGVAVQRDQPHPRRGRIEVALSRAEGTVGLAVSDTGPGLDPTAVDQLFQRFHRGSSDGARYGLGLALLREVVTRHRGTVAASGRPGHGARFTIRLPEYASTALRPARPLLTVPTWRAVGPRRGRPRPAGGPVRPGDLRDEGVEEVRARGRGGAAGADVGRLAQTEGEGAAQQPEQFRHVVGAQGGLGAEGDDVLVVQVRRQALHARRCRVAADLREERGTGELHALESVLLTGHRGEHRRQSLVARRVGQQVELAFGEVAELGGDGGEQVGRERGGLPEEVPAVHHLALRRPVVGGAGEQQRVVADAAEVGGDHAVDVPQRVLGGAEQLGAQRMLYGSCRGRVPEGTTPSRAARIRAPTWTAPGWP